MARGQDKSPWHRNRSRCNLLPGRVFNCEMQLEIRRACRTDWCRDTIWLMLHSTRGVTKYLMRAGARGVTLKAFLPTLSRRSQSLSHFPDRCPGHCSNQTYFSERKPDPASCQCHQSHSIPSPLLSGMHFSHPFLFSIPLVSRQRCPGQSRGSVFSCPRSIHPLWWNRILGPPLCLLVSISGWCMISVTDWARGGG